MSANYPHDENYYNRLPFHIAARPQPKQHGMAGASIMCPKCRHTPATYKWSKLDENENMTVECTNCHAKFQF